MSDKLLTPKPVTCFENHRKFNNILETSIRFWLIPRRHLWRRFSFNPHSGHPFWNIFNKTVTQAIGKSHCTTFALLRRTLSLFKIEYRFSVVGSFVILYRSLVFLSFSVHFANSFIIWHQPWLSLCCLFETSFNLNFSFFFFSLLFYLF